MWIYKGSCALIAGSNRKIRKTEERFQSNEHLSKPTKPTCDYLSHEQKLIAIYNYQTLKTVYGPPLRKIYLYGCPFFNNCISTTVQNRQFRVSETIGCILHRGLSENKASQNDFTHLLSEYKKGSVQSECSSASHLLTLSELEVLGTSVKHTPNLDDENNLTFTGIRNACNLSIVQCECRCSLCLNRKKAIKSSVSKAKRFIDEAVHNSCTSTYLDKVPHSFQTNCQFYLVNLAHIVLVIACLRTKI